MAEERGVYAALVRKVHLDGTMTLIPLLEQGPGAEISTQSVSNYILPTSEENSFYFFIQINNAKTYIEMDPDVTRPLYGSKDSHVKEHILSTDMRIRVITRNEYDNRIPNISPILMLQYNPLDENVFTLGSQSVFYYRSVYDAINKYLIPNRKKLNDITKEHGMNFMIEFAKAVGEKRNVTTQK